MAYNSGEMRPVRSHLLALIALMALLAPGTSFAAPRVVIPATQLTLLWPLEVPGTLLSSFGEYRYDHLHAGIDISTEGATGYKVLAAAAGEVYRLKVEWRGYGRALYLRHPGGRFTVYGHLERFDDARLRLERLVARRQSEAGTRYPGDIYLNPPLRVRRGQVIGYSGESGVGLPHLHFEVRDGEDSPVNPFQSGLRPPLDRLRPILEQLVVTSASEETFIDGVLREKTFPLRRNGENLTSDDPVRVSGPFLVSLTAHDPAGADGRAGVQSIHMTIDGTARYHIAFRSFRFEQYPLSGLIYDHRLSRLGPATFTYRLVRLPGNDLATSADRSVDLWPESIYPGSILLAAGRHLMEIAARDAAGNQSMARICVLVASPSRPRILTIDRPAGLEPVARLVLDPLAEEPGPTRDALPCLSGARGVQAEVWSGSGDQFLPATCDVSEGIWVCRLPTPGNGAIGRVMRLRETRLGVPGPWEIAAPKEGTTAVLHGDDLRLDFWPGFLDVLLNTESPAAGQAFIGAGPDARPMLPLTYRDGLRLGAAIGYRSLSQFSPVTILGGSRGIVATLALDARHLRTDEPLRYLGPGFAIDLPAGSPFFPGPLIVRTESAAGESALPSVSDAVDLLPPGEALRERATLTFDLDPEAVDPTALGIYRWDPFRSRWSYEGGEPDPSGRSLSVRFRRYGRFAMLQDASPPVVTGVHPGDGSSDVRRRPRIWARVEEEGKGLDFDGVRFILDGKPLDSEFDPDRGWSKVLQTPSLSPGLHRLEVKAVDLAGNPSEPVEATFTVR